MDEKASLAASRYEGRPWAILLVAAAAIAIASFPSLSGTLVGGRSSTLAGEWWRLWTGHLVHFSPGHLVWNLAVFATVGCWMERLAPRPTRVFLAVAPGVISAFLVAALPSLEVYAGLSGLAVGLLVMLALERLRRRGGEPRWLWWSVLALIAAKIGAETLAGATLFVRADDAFRPVPLAHLGGGACACIVHFLLSPASHARSRPDGTGSSG